MTKLAVVQSYREVDVPAWIQTCLDSVAQWTRAARATYEFRGDDLLTLAPAWYRDKVAHRTPVVADLARLLWIDDILATGHFDAVVWLDADTLIFSDMPVDVIGSDDCVFGYEHWLQQDAQQRVRVYRNVHNGFCLFRPGAPSLKFLIQVVQRLVREVDPAHIAPQFVGPKLLTSLHNTVKFSVEPRVGAISPLLSQAVLEQNTALLRQFHAALPQPLVAANLCASLADDIAHTALVEALLARGGLGSVG